MSFNADGVRAHGFQVLGLVDEIVDIINLAAHAGFGHGIADAALEMLAGLLDGLDHGFKVPVVI